MLRSLVGSEMCIRDRKSTSSLCSNGRCDDWINLWVMDDQIYCCLMVDLSEDFRQDTPQTLSDKNTKKSSTIKYRYVRSKYWNGTSLPRLSALRSRKSLLIRNYS
eukprot:TRINITY_DN36351_c0_g1_i1.p1 TRINITY_DN36351_c0_g1~~TRINITY_DN36351_c0_g1_i1.p1  ORF type:complete len:117 (-),score=17.52 TRINITY_DN36351_c0_g1_i1:152-466(-)